MSNEWFQFRKFLVRQDRVAMKVGTDGVLLGAWVTCCRDAYLRPFGKGNMMDVGTGTGLIALMLAQQFSEARIVALEIDGAAAQQAKANVAESLWSDRIEVVQADFRSWSPVYGQKFDLIVCNPPFFSQSLKNPDIQRAMARHDDDLSLTDLIPKSASLLTETGKLALILPVGRIEEAMGLASDHGLFLHRRLDVKGNAQAPVKRVLAEWGMMEQLCEADQMVIETEERGVYSEAYKRVTGEFYPGFRGDDKASR